MLRSMPEIETLYFYGHYWSVGSFSLLQCIGSSCAKLKVLIMYIIHSIRVPAAMPPIVLRCPLLEHVELDIDPSLSDPIMLALAHGCPALRTLHLKNGGTVVGMRAVLQGCPLLENLTLLAMLPYPSASSDLPLAETTLPSLSELHLVSTDITDNQLCSLLCHTPNLTSLCLNCGPLITHTTVNTLAQYCKKLKEFLIPQQAKICITIASMSALPPSVELLHVSARSTPAVTTVDLVTLAAGCPRLIDIVLPAFANDVTVEDILTFIGRCPRLRVFVYNCNDHSKIEDPRSDILTQRVKALYPRLRFI